MQRQVPVGPVIEHHLDHVFGFCVDQRAQSPVDLEVAGFLCFERWTCVLLKYDWSWRASTKGGFNQMKDEHMCVVPL